MEKRKCQRYERKSPAKKRGNKEKKDARQRTKVVQRAQEKGDDIVEGERDGVRRQKSLQTVGKSGKPGKKAAKRPSKEKERGASHIKGVINSHKKS